MRMKWILKWILIFLLAVIFLTPTSVFALSIVVQIPEKYTDVQAGERFYFEIEIKYPENPLRKDLRLNYEISKDGEVIAQSKILKAIETQASFMDYIVIPTSAKGGLHIINIKITDYENLSEEAFASFQVIEKKNVQLKLYFFILLGAILFVGMLVLINIFLVKKISK